MRPAGSAPLAIGRRKAQGAKDAQGFEQTCGRRSGGRGGKWGNPFRIGPDGDRAAVIAKHGAWLRDQHDLLRSMGELRGKDLVCFCAPAACHGDLLLRLANGTREEMIA
jgi:hypothetical protein